MALGKDLTPLTDQEVVALARAGHDTAYRELLRRYERPVFSLIYRMVRDRALAEDLSQDTFVKVLNALDSYRPEFKFSSWVFKIANNVAIDQLRPVARRIPRRPHQGRGRGDCPPGGGPDRVAARGARVA